jgi:betaine-homocysteine S-methyltransferase
MDIRTRLQAGTVLSDGGSLFELERRGYVQAGPYTPEVAIEHPEALFQMHREFRRAGAEVVQALAFYGSGDKAGRQANRINRSAVRIARQAAEGALVAGGLSPTPTFREGKKGALELMRRHLAAQAEEGVDLVACETFCWLEEALLAVQAVRQAGLYCLVTMNISSRGSRDGHSVEECARRLVQEGADCVGVNCSYDPDIALQVAQRMRAAVDCPIACQPIAYRSGPDEQPFETWPEFPLDLERRGLGRGDMARFAAQARAIGVSFIGGCCGVAPHQLRAMAEALGRRPPASDKTPDLSRHIIAEVRQRVRP